MNTNRSVLLLLIPTAGLLHSETEIPEGLTSSDWSSIRAARDAACHTVQARPDGIWTARNPGQGWHIGFDGDGFLVRPDHGSWTWGMTLESVAGDRHDRPHGVSADGSTLTYHWSATIDEWFRNDHRGLEQGWTIHSGSADGSSDPLTLTLGVRGGLKPVISASRQSVSFCTASGATALVYGGLKAWDANDMTLPARFVAGEDDATLTVEIDDSGAVYPITIDPVAQEAYLKASNTDASDRFGLTVAVSGDTVVVGAPWESSAASGVNGDQSNTLTQAGAAYVFVRNGTTWSQEAYLKASNPGIQDNFGWEVGISGDTIVVGAYFEDSGAAGINGNQADNSASNAGAVYVFTRSGTTWSQEAYLKASNPDANDHFGRELGISGDTVVVGSWAEDSNATGIGGNELDNTADRAGAAYIFVRSGTTWSQQAYLKASNAQPFDYFGGSVAISGDTVVVGANTEDGLSTGVNGDQQNDGSNYDTGAAYVFVRTGTTWSQEAYLKASNTWYQDNFGISVGVSGDTIVVGADKEDSAATGVNGDESDDASNNVNTGAAYVFVRSGTTWSQEAYLKASNTGAGDTFGGWVGISGDAVVVGAIAEDGSTTGVDGDGGDNGAPDSGAAYVFTRSGTTWTQLGYLKASNTGAGDGFGFPVAISGDTVVVGAIGEASAATGVNGDGTDDSAPLAGAAYVFDLNVPEIGVEQPAGTDLVSDVSTVEFILIEGETSLPLDFVIGNTGTADLTGVAAGIGGVDAADFMLTTPPPGTVAGSGSAPFTVTFAPSSTGERNATLSIDSNDIDESPFTITLFGATLSCTVDGDGDGMNDAAEHLLRDLGFDWQETQAALVGTYFAHANKAGLFTTSQVQALYAPTPVISRDPTTGKFTVTMDWKRSTDLNTFLDFPASGPEVSVNPAGDIEFELDSGDDAAFFQMELE